MQNFVAVPAGWAIPPWCEAANISRATFYNLPSALRPHSVKIRRRRVIIESPADYLQRIRSLQQVA